MKKSKQEIERAKLMAKDLTGFTNKELSTIVNNDSPIHNPVNNKNRQNVIIGILSDEFGDDIINYGVIDVKDIDFSR